LSTHHWERVTSSGFMRWSNAVRLSRDTSCISEPIRFLSMRFILYPLPNFCSPRHSIEFERRIRAEAKIQSSIALIEATYRSGKPVAAVCHGVADR
jgi:hypothetical protein